MATTKVQSELIVDDVALAGNPTTSTQSAGNNTTRIATTAFVTAAIDNLVDSAPGTMNTLNEIAAALNDDANFNTTVTNSIAAKLPLAGGTMTGALNMGTQNITNGGSVNGTDFRVNEGNSLAGGLFKEKNLIGSGSSNDLSIFAEGISYGGNIHFMSGGSATIRATLDSNGNLDLPTANSNLGVGDDVFVSSNYSTVNVRGATGGQILMGRNSGANDWDFFLYTTDGLTRMGVASGDDLAFHTDSSGSSNERLRITSDGKVGINTTSAPAGLPLQTKVSSGDNKLRMTTANKDAFILELKDATGDVHLGTNTTAGALVIEDDGDVYVGGKFAVNNAPINGTTVYVKKDSAGTVNLMRWGEGDGSTADSYRFRIDQNFDFIANSGSGDTFNLDSATGTVELNGNINLAGGGTVEAPSVSGGEGLQFKAAGSIDVIIDSNGNSGDNQNFKIYKHTNTTLMTVNESGSVTLPSQPGFFARGNTSQWLQGYTSSWNTLVAGIAHANGTTIGVNLTEGDTGHLHGYDAQSDFAPSNGRFTAPTDGKYHIHGSVYCTKQGSSAGDYIHFLVYVNGQQINQMYTIGGHGAAYAHDFSLNISSILRLDEDDYVEWKIYTTSTNVRIYGDHLCIGAHMIS